MFLLHLRKQLLPLRCVMVQVGRGSKAIVRSRTNLVYRSRRLSVCLPVIGVGVLFACVLGVAQKPSEAVQKLEHPKLEHPKLEQPGATLQQNHLAVGCSIAGTVRNPQGSVLPGAMVTIQPMVGAARTLTADGAGHFCAVGLPDGRYSITVERSGSHAIRLEAVNVAAGHSAQADAVLPLLALQGFHPPPPMPVPIAPPPPQPTPVAPSHAGGDGPNPQHHMHHLKAISHGSGSNGSGSGAPASVDDTPATTSPGGTDDLGEEEAKWFSQLPSGSIRYDVPPQMTIGVPSTVTVTIDGYKAPAQGPNSDGSAPSALKVADWMRVEISQPGNPDEFTITGDPAQNPQFVPIDSGATWSWTVTPNHLGTEKKLQFQAFVLYRDDKSKVQRELPSTQKVVTVQAEGVKGIVHQEEDNFWLKPDNWFKYMLPGGAGFGALVALYGWWQKRGKKGDAGK